MIVRSLALSLKLVAKLSFNACGVTTFRLNLSLVGIFYDLMVGQLCFVFSFVCRVDVMFIQRGPELLLGLSNPEQFFLFAFFWFSKKVNTVSCF